MTWHAARAESGIRRQKAKAPQLLTEIERQKSVLAELPDKYEFPLFDGRQAIESQRKCSNKKMTRIGARRE